MAKLNPYFIIPAHVGSTRLKEKLLLPSFQFPGKPLLYDSFHRLQRIFGMQVFVASDSLVVKSLMTEWGFGRQFIKTGKHPNGSQRVAEAAKFLGLQKDELVVNFQADEVSFPVTEFHSFFAQYEQAQIFKKSADIIGTFIAPLRSLEEYKSPDVVKVATAYTQAKLMFAQYFSRSPIPYFSDPATWAGRASWQHIGIYCAPVKLFQTFGCHPNIEGLEQIQPLLSGTPFYCHSISQAPLQINTQKDYDEYKRLFSYDQK